MPDARADGGPVDGLTFIMNQEGVSRLFSRGMMRDGPFPTHMEPFESPMANVFNARMRGNPVARVFESDVARLGTSDEFPFVATSYRLTEHFHYWTKHNRVNAALQPEFFVEISVQLAEERGITNGSRVRVFGKRGLVWAKAVVTRRLQPLICDGKACPCGGHSAALGLHGGCQEGLGAEQPDAVHRGCEHGHARIQGVPGQHRTRNRGAGGMNDMANSPTTAASNPPVQPTEAYFDARDVVRISATRNVPQPDRQLEKPAKLIDVSKCIGCKACQSARVEWNDTTRRWRERGVYENPHDLTPTCSP